MQLNFFDWYAWNTYLEHELFSQVREAPLTALQELGCSLLLN
jgi:hypothetical protein